MSLSTSRSTLWNVSLGNLFEHYDTALFGLLSSFLAPLMFPEHDALTALILTYAMHPLGLLARPIGSLVFGYIGDVYGRGRALFLTLAGMGLVSGCIGLSPTYAQIGVWAPLIFCLGRVLQNFFAAGETMGGAILLLENTSEKRHDLISGWYNASTMGGHLLASCGVFLLAHYGVIDGGWRLLYLFGCVTAIFGCMMRKSSPLPPRAITFSKSVSDMKMTLWTYRKPLLFIAICSGFGCACYSVALVLMNGFIPLISTITKAEMMKINTGLIVLDFCALPFFGWVASRMPRERVMVSAALGVVLCAIPLFLCLQGASLTGVIAVRIALVMMGVAFFAPFHAWAAQLVPAHARYAVISLGYALGSQLLGSPTAAFALWCFQKTGVVSSVAWYWMALGLASSGVLMIALRSKNKIIINNSVK
jgi:MFS transporter, MHS family, proline/betaine transporter